MNILVWICESCKKRCIAPFNGNKTESGYLVRPENSCIWTEGHETNPWKLRKMDDTSILKWFIDANKKRGERV